MKLTLHFPKAEGERKGMLKDVLIECVTKLDKDPKRGKQGLHRSPTPGLALD